MGLAVLCTFGRAEVILDHKLPAGWKFKSFSVSRSGYKALFLLPDLPDMMSLTNGTSRRLQVLDNDGNLVKDMILEDWYWLSGFTRDDKIILSRGDESGCWRIKVLEPDGRVRFCVDAGGRWPAAALFGHEIALVPGVSGDVAPCSIIDAETGIEKFRIGPLSRARPDACFASIGEDGLYIAGIERALFLRSYRHEGKDLWKIENIGGTIEHYTFLDDKYFAVQYKTDDFEAGRFMVGNAVIEWRSGDVLYEKRGFQIDGKQDDWYRRLFAFGLRLDRGDLVFLIGDGLGVRIPRKSPPGEGWDESRLRKIKWPPDGIRRVSPTGKSVRAEVQGTYLIWDFGDSVRIERAASIDDTARS
ncbi:MAG: hypothetical protein IMZ54_05640 [Acidobacteria bacterium]|nr:hypothetical protein [Acidobacteriota bacterium]